MVIPVQVCGQKAGVGVWFCKTGHCGIATLFHTLSGNVSSAARRRLLHYIPCDVTCPTLKKLAKLSGTGQMLMMGILRRT